MAVAMATMIVGVTTATMVMMAAATNKEIQYTEPPSRPLVAPASCCFVSHCIPAITMSHCIGWLLHLLSTSSCCSPLSSSHRPGCLHLVAPPSCRLVTSAACRIAPCHPLVVLPPWLCIVPAFPLVLLLRCPLGLSLRRLIVPPSFESGLIIVE